MPLPITKDESSKPKRKIADYLIYEVMDGKPIYYTNEIGSHIDRNNNLSNYESLTDVARVGLFELPLSEVFGDLPTEEA